jgi:very-short-patch-repair endonuclease
MKKRRKRPPKRKYRTVEQTALLLRKHMTKAESYLWTRLRKRQRDWTHKFEPQVPVHGYIPDFYCEALQLAVEIDGRIHLRADVRRNDKIRTRRLNRMGVTVIRFNNQMVFNNPDKILDILEEVCE